jgi:tetratricopeptide (TPR) repeat protein
MPTAAQLYNEAEKLKDAGKLEESIAKFEEALTVDQGHVLSHLALAVMLGRVGKHEQAVKHGQQACELEPGDPFNFTALSVTYQRAFAGTQNHQYIHMAEDAMARAHMLQQRR